MRKYLLLFFLVSLGSTQAKEWQPPEEFLRAVCFVESSNGQFVYGDSGRSLGDFQLSESAWMDVNNWRKARRLRTYSYDRHVFNSFINKVYASNYMSIIYAELSRKLGRQPTPGEVYAAYNIGLGTFAQCNYKLHRVNAVTRQKCELITELMVQLRDGTAS
jgi:hypothetical protein